MSYQGIRQMNGSNLEDTSIDPYDEAIIHKVLELYNSLLLFNFPYMINVCQYP